MRKSGPYTQFSSQTYIYEYFPMAQFFTALGNSLSKFVLRLRKGFKMKYKGLENSFSKFVHTQSKGFKLKYKGLENMGAPTVRI